jgi:hypothetical protein
MPSQQDGLLGSDSFAADVERLSSSSSAGFFASEDPFAAIERVSLARDDPFTGFQIHDPFARPINATRWTITTPEEARESEQYLAALEKRLKEVQTKHIKGKKNIVDYAILDKEAPATSAWINILEDVDGRPPSMYISKSDVKQACLLAKCALP